MTFPAYDPSHPLWWDDLVPKTPKPGAIPRIIHQIWIGPKPRPKKLMDGYRDMHPDWTYILWTEKNLKYLTWKNQKHIDEMPEWNGKADLYRYELLLRFGGVWMDADSECLAPFDDFFLENDSFAIYENEKHRGGLVACGVIGATPGNELMRLCVDEIHSMPRLDTPAWWSVGPVFFTWVVGKHQYPIKVYPGHWFIPNHYTGEVYSGPDKIYADHKWGTAKHLYGELA